MADVTVSMTLVDNVSSALNRINSSLDKTDAAMSQVDKASKTVESSTGKMGAIAGAVGGLVSSGVSRAIDAIGSLTSEMVAASDSTDKFKQGLQFSGLGADEIEKLTSATQTYADQTVYDLGDIRNATMQLASNGVPNYDKLAEAAGNLNAVVGGNADTYKSVTQAMVQTAGAGKLTTENWNQITDAIGGAAGPLQEELRKTGAYTGNFRDAMADGQITAEEFNKALMNLGFDQAAVDAAKSTKTFEGAMGNLQASVVKVGMNILDNIKKPLTDAMSFAADAIDNLANIVGPALSGAFNVGGSLLQPLIKAFQTAAPFFSTFKATVMSVGSQIETSFTPVIQTLSTALGQVVNTIMPPMMQFLSSLTGALGGVVAAVAPIINQLIGVLLPVLAQIHESVLSMMTPIITMIGQAAAELAPLISQIISTLMPTIQQISTVITTVLLPVIQDIGTNIIATVVPAIQQIVTTIGQLLPPIMNLIDVVLPIIMSLVQTMMPIIVNAANIILSTVGPVISGIATAIQGVIQTLQGVIDFVIGVFTGNWQMAWSGIQNIFGGIWNAIRGVFTAVWEGIKGAISAGLAYISGLWNSIWSSVSSFVSSAWEGIKSAVSNGINGMMSFVTGIPGKIKDVFSRAGDWLLNAGKDIINGLVNGIKNAIGGAINAVKNVAGKVVDAAKNFFKIGSPSKVFFGFGRYIDEGLANGITAGAGGVNSAMTAMSGGAIAAAQSKLTGGRLDLSSGISGAKIMAPSLTGDMAGHRTRTVNNDYSRGPVNITINGYNKNPEQLAREIAEVLGE